MEELSEEISDKQKALKMSNVTYSLGLIFENYSDKKKIIDLINNQLTRISPKTRR